MAGTPSVPSNSAPGSARRAASRQRTNDSLGAPSSGEGPSQGSDPATRPETRRSRSGESLPSDAAAMAKRKPQPRRANSGDSLPSEAATMARQNRAEAASQSMASSPEPDTMQNQPPPDPYGFRANLTAAAFEAREKEEAEKRGGVDGTAKPKGGAPSGLKGPALQRAMAAQRASSNSSRPTDNDNDPNPALALTDGPTSNSSTPAPTAPQNTSSGSKGAAAQRMAAMQRASKSPEGGADRNGAAEEPAPTPTSSAKTGGGSSSRTPRPPPGKGRDRKPRELTESK
eukprot:gnl/TRDRNA2_/TRDRNA2_144379_c1_seq1.p1 gnl/TRDRNA2_/TRDRNA2_144379_c1~~gnl/TRDRNA2_/TRDRNA2_144379_c1_seq1.p1  ORF type:complete len:319 (+),score=43.54 gnl/TRDRNA2_/TRDRNA2_144379_c1_seq1:100-957(+)